MKSKILKALLSLALALALWMYVVTVVSPGSEAPYRNVSVTLQNENALTERGLMVTSYTEKVDLTLAGNRSDLNKLTSGGITVTANLSGITEEGTYQLNYTPSYSGAVASGSIAVQKRNPDFVTVTVEARKTKTVDVTLEFQGSVPDGFIADKEQAELETGEVEISGPASIVDQIHQARIAIDLTGQNQSVSGIYEFTLCDVNGDPVDDTLVTSDVESIGCTVRIQRIKEIELSVKVLAGGGATEENSTVTVSPKTIRISGSEALLEKLDKLELGTVDLATVREEDEPLIFNITLPEGINNETGVNEATVEVKFEDLHTRALKVGNIKAVNVPTGMSVDMVTRALDVTLRGPADLLKTITEKQVSIAVDFTDAQPGTATMKAQITTDPAYAAVGAVGTYSVACTVRGK